MSNEENLEAYDSQRKWLREQENLELDVPTTPRFDDEVVAANGTLPNCSLITHPPAGEVSETSGQMASGKKGRCVAVRSGQGSVKVAM